jgi:hypothetical protein
MMRCAELFSNEVKVDFVDLNLGCPLDLICDQGRSVFLVLGKEKNSRKLCVGLLHISMTTTRAHSDMSTFIHLCPASSLWD